MKYTILNGIISKCIVLLDISVKINSKNVLFGGLIMLITRVMKLLGLLFIVGLLLSGCIEEEKTVSWELSPPFNAENLTLHGIEGKFGIIKVNGEGFEPEFPVDQGRLYHVLFLDSSKDFNGKKYKMIALHQDADESIKLYEDTIESNKSGAKFFLDKKGLWKIDVFIDDEHYTSFIVEATSS